MFRFKRFDVEHEHSAMKIGVDAVLLGAWVRVSDTRDVLDAGCGCGILALMIQQRQPKAEIVAVDIDVPSVAEAGENFANFRARNGCTSKIYEETICEYLPSPVSVLCDFKKYCEISDPGSVDLIVSNPPYFRSGIVDPDSPRLAARHAASLSPEILIEHGSKLLSFGGRIAMILPCEFEDSIVQHALKHQLYPYRLCRVRGHASARYKRLLCEFTNVELPCETTELTLEEAPGVPTPQYLELCRDFYLKW